MTKGELKEFKTLKSRAKSGSLTDAEKKRLDELSAKDAEFKKSRKGDKPDKKRLGDPGNDFSWWNKLPQLTSNAANMKSNWIAGTSLAGTNLPYTPAGVLRIKLRSVYGSDATATDPINVWARDLYLKFFQKWRGVNGYTASDLGITIIAAVEAVKLIAKYERIYGIVNRYSRLNVNMPIAEQAGLGLTAAECDYLRSHLSDFRYDLNVLIQKAQRLCVPKDMSIISDALSLLGYEYLDHESSKSQIIIFDTTTYGTYADTFLQSGGCIQFLPFDSSHPLFDFNADNMCIALDGALNVLLGSDSVQKIFADMVVWFGDGSMLQINPLPPEYIVTPVKSESILHKMHNIESQNLTLASIVKGGLSTTDKNALSSVSNKQFIYQCDDKIITELTYNMAGGTKSYVSFNGDDHYCSTQSDPVYNVSPHVLDTYRAEATEEVVVEGTLFKYQSVVISDGTNYTYKITSVAFWLVEDLELIEISNGAASALSIFQYSQVLAQAQARAGQLALIDWAPLTFYVSGGIVASLYGDIDNPIMLYSNDISRILTTVLYSGLFTSMTASA